MANQNEIFSDEQPALHDGNKPGDEASQLKKPFVEPMISDPVDVLEATTFFQAATSGATN